MIIVNLVIFITAIASGSFIFFIRKDNRVVHRLILAFSGAFLISLTFLKLVPEIFSVPSRFTGIFILIGFLIQLVLELFTEGAEHGHSHRHSDDERVSPMLLLVGLCIHSFLEGMPIVMDFETTVRHTLVLGIVIHNIPISLTLMAMFLHYGCSKRKAFLYLVIFALMTPLGSLFSNLLEYTLSTALGTLFNYMLAIVVGIFLHVSTSILFETEENHQYNLQKFFVVCFGIAIALGISFI
jgi:zinc and cadmium transporter